MWAYDLDNIIPTCRDFEDKLIKLVWNQRLAYGSLASSAAPSASDVNLTEKAVEIVDEKEVAAIVEQKVDSSKRTDGKQKSRGCRLGLGYFVSSKEDIEKTAQGPSERPMRLLAPFYAGVSAAMSICGSTPFICAPPRANLCACVGPCSEL